MPSEQANSRLRAFARPRTKAWARVAAGAILLVAASFCGAPRPLLVWNVSNSAPLGLYSVGGRADLRRGEMVIARPPRGFRLFAARRGYLPLNVPLVKRVAAVAGDRVCADGATLRVNDVAVAQRRSADGLGRTMPHWSGCILVGKGEALLLMSTSPASFDGRYFGVSSRSDIVGRASLLWAR